MSNQPTTPTAPAAPAAPLNIFPPIKAVNMPAVAPVQKTPAAAPSTTGGAPVTSLSQIIAYSKANPNTSYAQQAYKLIKSGAFDQEAQKEGVDLSWAGRPKLTDTTTQTDTEGQDEGQETAPSPTLGDLDMQQLQSAAQKIIDSVQNAGTKEQHDANGTVFGEAKGVGDVLEGLLGASSGIVGGIAAPVSAVLQKALQYDPAKATDAEMANDPAFDAKQQAASQQFATAHPELVQNLKDAINVGGAFYGGTEGLIPGGDMSLSDFAQTGKGVLEDAATTVKNGAGKFTDAAFPKSPVNTAKVPPEEPPAGGAPGTVSKVRNSAIASAIGVQPSTVQDILARPDLYTTENMANASRQNIAEEVAAGVNNKVAALEKMKVNNSVSPRALADQVDTGIKLREHKLEQTAKTYGEITGSRTPGSTEGPNINVNKNWLNKEIQEATGRPVKVIKVKDPVTGKPLIDKTTKLPITRAIIDDKPNLASSVRDPKDIAALQKFLDTRGPAFKKATLSGNEFLNLRDDLTGLAHFDKSGGMPSTALEGVGKQLRSNLNDRYRGKFPGLEEADADYTRQKEDLDRLKVGLIDNQGNLSENAMTRIRNAINGDKNDIGNKLEEIVPGIKARVQKLTDIENEQNRYRAGIVDQTGHLLDGAANRIANAGGIGKDLLSSRLEEVAPGIGDKLKFLKGVEDIKGASGIKTGSYIKAGLTLLSGPFGLATFAITHPDVAVPLLRKFGMSAEDAARTAEDLGVAPKK